MQKRFVVTYIVLFLVARGLADELAPQEPEIILPPMLLQIEDLHEENLTVLLPEGESLKLEDLPVQLPEPALLEIPPEALDVKDTDGTMTRPQGSGSSLYSQGLLGIGLMNQFIGEIGLHKLGDFPRFNVEFSHESMDGYALHEAGAGYSHSTDSLKGDFIFGSPNFKYGFKTSYLEQIIGLQGRGAYSSLNYRFFDFKSLETDIRFQQGIPLTLTPQLNTEFVKKTLVGTNPYGSQEITLDPGIKAKIDLGPHYLGVSGIYHLRSFSGKSSLLTQSLEGNLFSFWQLPWEWGLDALGGLVFDLDRTLDYQVHLKLNSPFAQPLRLSVEGGYKVEPLTFYTLWKSHPFLDESVPAVTSRGFFASSRAEWDVKEYLTLLADVDFQNLKGVPNTSGVLGSGQVLFPFTLQELMLLNLSAGLRWAPFKQAHLSLWWTERLLDRLYFESERKLEVGGGISTQQGKLGADFNFEYNFSNIIPQLDLSGFFRAFDGVLFILEMKDVLLALSAQGTRYAWEPYVEPGFQIVLKTEFSF